MDKRGEFKLQGMLIGILVAFGLFFTLISSTVLELGGVYDTSEADLTDLENYSHLYSLSQRMETYANDIDQNVTVDKNAFDYLAGIFQKTLAPFKFIYKSYTNLFTVSSSAVNDLNLFPVFSTWARAVIIILVLIGIVLLTVYLKVRK